MNSLFLSAGISFLICLIITPILIPFLHRLKFGQCIREEGPSWHRAKSGTPTTVSYTHLTLPTIYSV